ncbi:hypothetical protein [uncultured Draconibacterium sp.]|uniref:hypothetical protein n=1 Tax=uncultured Draconibacterium sp. TaxID=1573823 RepID=UPI0025CD2CC9|nr:hypothetical protein [uncultured Draconibacterium sp.]
MNYSVTSDHSRKLILYKHNGILEEKDIGYVWVNEFLKMPEFTAGGYNLLSDYTEARFKMTPNDVSLIVDFMRNIVDIVNGKKQGIVINDPFSTAASLLFEQEVNREIGFRVKVFSTKEAALKWLLDPEA